VKVKLQEVIDEMQTNPIAETRRIAVRLQQYGIEVPYTPMTYDEMHKIWADGDGSIHDGLIALEQAVLNRLGIAPVVKESLITELDQAKQICEQAGWAVVPNKPVLMVNSEDLKSPWFAGINAVNEKHEGYGKRYDVPLYAMPEAEKGVKP
jgi:hypothetical protein